MNEYNDIIKQPIVLQNNNNIYNNTPQQLFPKFQNILEEIDLNVL